MNLTLSHPQTNFFYETDEYCDTMVADVSTSKKWNPNVPFHCTQEEFTEHIHSIERGNFMTIEEADKKFEAWKKEFLASRI